MAYLYGLCGFSTAILFVYVILLIGFLIDKKEIEKLKNELKQKSEESEDEK